MLKPKLAPPPKPNLSLAQHIAKLKEKKALQPVEDNSEAIVFWGTYADKNFLPQFKGCVGSTTTFLRFDEVTTFTQVSLYCKTKGITRVISTSISLLKKVLDWDQRAAPSLANYAGSYFTIPGFKGSADIEVVFIQPLKQLVTVAYGKFMATRLVSKLVDKDKWPKPTEFNGFEVLTASNEAHLFVHFSEMDLICIDVETLREDAVIRCLSYTGFYFTESLINSYSVVLPLDSDYALAIMRKWNWDLKAPKIFQNGKYDIAYFCRYSAPVYNYLYDTANLMHCWYSELPKDLGFLNAFFIREAVYYKDLAKTNDLHEYYKYNALDTWATGNCFLAMMHEAPQWAIQNYLQEFPLVFPCHLSEMTGIARDMSVLDKANKDVQAIIDVAQTELNIILDVPAGETFNVNSPKQMKQLLGVLGCKDLKSADAKNLKKAKYRHPFNARVINLVSLIRKNRKGISTYLTEGKEFTRQDGTGHRMLYALNPHATDTSRLASKEHHFWCGANIQNITRGPTVKQTYKADEGFLLFEVDLEQAESRDTAYISGDKNLIENVEHSPDFHCSNASAFFGVPFEEMYDIVTNTVLNKPLRQLGKPINHGANYNMGAYVLIDTMGEELIALARKLLGLPRYWSYVRVAEYLLEQFHRTYPGIEQTFYRGVIEEVRTTGMLASKAWHHQWNGSIFDDLPCIHNSYEEELAAKGALTRYCFSDPTKSKPALNAYIAHPPQSLNAMTLNKAYLSVFRDIAMSPIHGPNFKLCCQVHDSILGQVRIGHEHLVNMVVDRMEIPVTIKAYDDVIRTFVVPAGKSSLGTHWDRLK